MTAEFLSPTEFARTVGCSRQHVYRMADEGYLASARLGGRLLIPVTELDRLRSEAAG